MDTKQVWFITGASKGLGLCLVKELLLQDYFVVATSRKPEALVAAIGNDKRLLPLEMDLTNNESVAQGVQAAIDQFGRIDFVVNNAGYGQIGTLEELSDQEAKSNFDVNVFGTLNVIRNTVPYLRKQRSGHIFNVASIAGLIGNFPAFGVYCATKFAVAGLTEALAVEMKPFGIHTTIVYPGYFRTEFLANGSIQTPLNPIKEYVSAREAEATHLNQIHGNQPNDPQKAAKLFIELSNLENPPVHFIMGEDAYNMAQMKIDLLRDETEKWKDKTIATTF